MSNHDDLQFFLGTIFLISNIITQLVFSVIVVF